MFVVSYNSVKANCELNDVFFILLVQAYRHELLEAYECCINYKRTGKDAELTQVAENWKQTFS